MTDMTSEQVKRLDMRAIGKIFRETARKQRVHKSITNEDALDLVNIVAIHGDRLADAIGLFFHAERARPEEADKYDEASGTERAKAEAMRQHNEPLKDFPADGEMWLEGYFDIEKILRAAFPTEPGPGRPVPHHGSGP